MSLIYANGYDALTGYDTNALREYMKAEGWYFENIDHFFLTPGRFGGSAVYCAGGAGIGPYNNRRPFLEYGPVTEDSVILGARITYPDANANESRKVCFYQGVQVVMMVEFATTGSIRCICNGITALSRLGLFTLSGTGMMSMEYKLSDGAFRVKVNGDTVIDVSSSPTAGITQIDAWGIQQFWSHPPMNLDDVYVLQTDDVTPNTHLGNVRVRNHLVSGNGDVIQLDPVNAPTNWEAVQSPVLTKTSYVTTSVVGEYDLYQLADGSNARIIYGVTARVGAWQGDATQLRVNSILKTEGTEFPSADVATQSSSRIYAFCWGYNPSTDVAWTNEQVNAVQVGGKLVSTE